MGRRHHIGQVLEGMSMSPATSFPGFSALHRKKRGLGPGRDSSRRPRESSRSARLVTSRLIHVRTTENEAGSPDLMICFQGSVLSCYNGYQDWFRKQWIQRTIQKKQRTHSRHQSLGSTQGSGKLYVGEHAP